MEEGTALISEIKTLQAVFENSPAAIVIVDKRYRILQVNREFEKITGYNREDLEGKRKWTELVLTEDKTILENLLRVLKSDEGKLPEKFECRFVDKHGDLKIAFLRGDYLKDPGYIVLSLIDITEQKENEISLKSARMKAESSDRLKSAFLGNLSHEIRTPMNAIMGFASLLQMDELSSAKKNLYLTQIIQGSGDLLQLIEKTVILSRIDLGQIKINRKQFFVNNRLEELQVKYRKILDDHNKGHVEIALELGKQDNDFVIQADRIRVLDVLNNLLENAVKFTTSGKITIGYTYLEEESDQSTDSLLFYVKDTGCGISKEKTGIIFERFVKMVDKHETVLRGAGLGLAISYDLVKLMGGNIWVDTTPGEGSKFYFTLPISYSRKQQTATIDKGSEKTYDDWSAYQVLIAEDVESNYLYMKELLAPTKICILRARDGIEAVELFNKNPETNVVLMDILMPGLDGYEATNQIRATRQEVPVIAQTAFSFEGEIQNGLYAGCFNDYIMKPFTRDMLYASMKKHLIHKK